MTLLSCSNNLYHHTSFYPIGTIVRFIMPKPSQFAFFDNPTDWLQSQQFCNLYISFTFTVKSQIHLSIFTLCASEAAVQCIVIAPVCLRVCLWVCYHNNSKLCASILTKLGLQVKVVTISSWLNFGHPVPLGRGLRRGKILGSALLQPACSVCISFEHFFHCLSFISLYFLHLQPPGLTALPCMLLTQPVCNLPFCFTSVVQCQYPEHAIL